MKRYILSLFIVVPTLSNAQSAPNMPQPPAISIGESVVPKATSITPPPRTVETQSSAVTVNSGVPVDFNEDFKNRIQEMMSRVEVVAVGEYTGKYKEHWPTTSKSANSYEYFFRPIQVLKGTLPKEEINLMHGFGVYFPKPADVSALYKKNGRYLLLLTRAHASQLQQEDPERPRPRSWYSLPYPNMIILLED